MGRGLRRLWSAEALALALVVVQGAVVARALGPHKYGVFALATTYAAFVFLLLDPRSGEAVVRYLSEYRARGDSRKARAVVTSGLLLDSSWSVAGIAIVAGTAGVGAHALGVHTQSRFLLFLLSGISAGVGSPATTARAVLSTLGRFDLFSRAQMTVSIVRAASLVAVARSGGGVIGVVATLTSVAAFEAALFIGLANRELKRDLGGGIFAGRPSELRERWREMGSFVLYADLTSLAGASIKQVDVLIVGLFSDPTHAGYLRLAKSLTTPASNFAGPIQTVLYPQVADAVARGDDAEVRRTLRHAVRRLGLPLGVATLVTLPFVSWFVRVFAGSKFVPATHITQVLLVGVAISFASIHQRPVFLALGEMKPFLLIGTGTALACVAGFFVAAPTEGALGVAFARTVLVTIGVLVAWLYLRRRVSHRGYSMQARPVTGVPDAPAGLDPAGPPVLVSPESSSA